MNEEEKERLTSDADVHDKFNHACYTTNELSKALQQLSDDWYEVRAAATRANRMSLTQHADNQIERCGELVKAHTVMVNVNSNVTSTKDYQEIKHTAVSGRPPQ